MLFLCQLLLNFQGTQVISQLRSLSFYLELQAKGRQYQSILLKNKILGVFEQIEGCVTRNLGDVDKKNQLTEKENVFFIKAGYSFCVLNYKNKGADNNDSSEE